MLQDSPDRVNQILSDCRLVRRSDKYSIFLVSTLKESDKPEISQHVRRPAILCFKVGLSTSFFQIIIADLPYHIHDLRIS